MDLFERGESHKAALVRKRGTRGVVDDRSHEEAQPHHPLHREHQERIQIQATALRHTLDVLNSLFE